ncbi:MAG: hypothetical protein LBL31_04295, partial [Spirochaetaceae bacterium]|nr:hypothetical protein [Spirochaetaceae bacterium]
MNKRTVNRCISGISVFLLALVLAACLLNEDSATGTPGDTGITDGNAPSLPPGLLGKAVSYDAGKGFAPTVTFTFDRNVTGSIPGWKVDGAGSKTLSATPAPETELVSGRPVTVTLTAANFLDASRTAEAAAAVMPVSGYFTRPQANTTKEYTLAWYDGASGTVALYSYANGGTGDLDGFLIGEEEQSLRALFDAVYTPNAPGSTDTVQETGKAAVAYNEKLSETVLGLFKITVGSAASGDRVEIKGYLPVASAETPGIDRYHPVVIDIGIGTPDKTALNSGLPVFSVPFGGLGSPDISPEDYRHILLRVNGGARLIIEADNTDGESAACPYGYVTGGTVEVMGGAELRNGAYRGFPLGKDSSIVARLNSRLAIGPENAANEYYAGWFVGSVADDARICWGSGDQNGSYIEIRDGCGLAFDVNLTVRKSIRVRHKVWFVNGPALTVSAQGSPIDGLCGLIAETGEYKFYGDFIQTGGLYPARPGATITVTMNNTLSRSLVTDEPGDGLIIAAD